MKDDTRLRDDLASRGSSIIPVAATDAGAARLVPAAEVYAALDLGTNNCRLLIACPTGDGFRVVDSFSRIIRLGEGISATGCISDAANDAVGVAGAHDEGIGLAPEIEIVGIFALATDQRVILLAADRLSDAEFLQCNSVFQGGGRRVILH